MKNVGNGRISNPQKPTSDRRLIRSYSQTDLLRSHDGYSVRDLPSCKCIGGVFLSVLAFYVESSFLIIQIEQVHVISNYTEWNLRFYLHFCRAKMFTMYFIVSFRVILRH